MTREILVLDTSPMVHFARAGALDTLEQLLKEYECVTIRAVRDELRRGTAGWAAVTGTHEASVLAWAEAHSAVAYVDDLAACNLGCKRDIRVHRPLNLVVNAVRAG